MPDKALKKTPIGIYIGYAVLSVFCYFYIYYAVKVNQYAIDHAPEGSFIITIWDYKRTVYSSIVYAILHYLWTSATIPYFLTIAKV